MTRTRMSDCGPESPRRCMDPAERFAFQGRVSGPSVQSSILPADGEEYPARVVIGPGHVADRCGDCRGTGGRRYECPTCDGLGYVGADPAKPCGVGYSLGRLVWLAAREGAKRERQATLADLPSVTDIPCPPAPEPRRRPRREKARPVFAVRELFAEPGDATPGLVDALVAALTQPTPCL